MCSASLQVRSDLLHITAPLVSDTTDPPDSWDVLLTVTGSRARAAILAGLFAAAPRWWGPSEIARASGQPHQTASAELRRLRAVGLVRLAEMSGRDRYYPETEDPIAVELARFIRQTRGRIPALRAALESFESPSIAWITEVPASASSKVVRSGGGSPDSRAELFVLTSVPTRLIRAHLLASGGADLGVQAMSAAEWVARLARRDVLVHVARRASKTWVRGSSGELIRWERAQRDARTTLSRAVANWRDELSDAWDEDWDPTIPDVTRG